MENNRILNLSRVPLIELLDLRPLTLALLHNTFFIGIILSDVIKPTALLEFTQLVASK